MKKLFKGLAVGLAAVCCMVAFGCAQGDASSSSSQTAEDGYVKLMAITGADAVGSVQADYFLLAEPAVSAQSKKGYSIAGDIQSLYGGENGYPQAVLVAKSSLIEAHSAWVNEFAQKLDGAAEWLKTASGETLVKTLNAHMLDENTQSSLKAPLLSAAAVGRCGVRFSYAGESKTEIEDFLTQMRKVNEKAAAIPDKQFYWNEEGVGGASVAPTRECTVYMPDGAPALAMAKLMHEDTEDDGFSYKVVAPATIASRVTNKDESVNADFCVLPITAASKLLGSGERYKMLGVVTHGNLYLIAKDGRSLTAENITHLQGKTVGVLQINEVPGLTLKTVLNKYGLSYKEMTNIN